MNVVIFGAGISGLTVAHELIEKGFKVEVYEKDVIAGGMARTYRNKDNVPTEHSWRGYAPFYYNTFEIMKRIPISENFSDLKEFTIEEIKKHNKEDDLWVIYKGNIYDISYYVKDHPGGKSNILSAAGKDLEKYWKEKGYEFHINNSHVISHLTRNKVGKLKETFKNKSVYDNLNHNGLDFKFLYNDEKGRGDPNLNFRDYVFLFFLFGKVIFSNLRRQDYFKIRLDPLLKKNLSVEGYHYIADFLAGPGFGFDKNTMSLGHYAIFVEFNLYTNLQKWKVMSKPTSEGWIDPWVKYLKDKGVKFHFKNELVNINFNEKNIISCEVKNNKGLQEINFDNYVMAINPFNLEEILKKNKNKINPLIRKISKMNTVNNQISFRLGFDKKIDFKTKYGGFVLIDSPYNITFYAQEDHWEKNIKLGMNGKIKTLISGTIIQPYNIGSYYKKSALSLKLSELKEEIIHQMFESNDFKKLLNGISKKNIIFKEIFSDWYEKKLTVSTFLRSKNKKWVNNFSNEEYRLEQKTNLNNFYISGGHCKTSVLVWSMEGSVESGKITSNLILEKYKKERCYNYKHESNKIVKLISQFDDCFYKLKLPNLMIEFILIGIYLIFYEMITEIIKKID